VLSVLALHAALDTGTPLFVHSRKHPALLFLASPKTVLAMPSCAKSL
jgi:hypothetical protein